MVATRWLVVLTLSSLLVAPVFGETAAVQERHVQRLVASPTPAGPLTILSDDASWRIEIPAATVVRVDAQANARGQFYLSYHRENQAEPDLTFPASRQLALLPGPGAWIVRIDPAAGAAFDARVLFEGFVGDVDGARSPFTLVDLPRERSCPIAGACLP